MPFTDVAGNGFFCQISEAYFSGLTNGTSPTTYSPSDSVPREQMAAFVTRTQDSALRRGSRRAALGQWSTPSAVPLTGRTTLPSPHDVASDGQDLWVANINTSNVSRVQASDGHVLGTWSSAQSAHSVLVARGRVFVSGQTSPGRLYTLDPSAAPTAVTTLSTTLGGFPRGITTDGSFIWTANGGSVSKVDPDTGVTTNVGGFGQLQGILFDGANLWVSDQTDGTLKKLDSSGAILQTVPVGGSPQFPVFDGSNIWVPNRLDNSLTVVRVRDGQVLATLTGNGLNAPFGAAFDGQRILVTNSLGSSVSLWKAADLSPIGSFLTGGIPERACSDGINFWITLGSTIARF